MNISNCAICDKKLSFWNQPIAGKGTLQTSERICSSCFMKINNKSPKTAANLRKNTLIDIMLLLRKITPQETAPKEKVDDSKKRTDPNAGSHLSEKLLRILKSKTNLGDDELNTISEAEGWNLVYSLKPKKEKLIEICFTGFLPDEKNELIEIAKEANFHVAKSVTQNLPFLCTGDDPGPAKIEKAKYQGVVIISKDQFLQMIETGEIPN